MLTVAAVQYPVAWLPDWAAYEAKMAALVAEAAGQGARLILFPEYAAMELASLLPPGGDDDLGICGLQALLPGFLDLHRRLARQYGVILVAGSFPVEIAHGTVVNRAHVLAPGGEGHQDKLMMTRFEREDWSITGGDALTVFDCDWGSFAIAICYDVEFPTLVRAQVAAGAELILAPSCTDGLAGFHRVRLCAQARAIENQCFVLQAPLVGEADWSTAVDINIGRAGLFAPADRGFPADGILAEGPLNQPAVVTGPLDLAHLRHTRRDGQVLNHRDWPEVAAGWRVERVVL